MADKVVLEAEVKSNIGEVSKDASSLAGEFRVMGVSLNSVKAGMASVGKTAKASFATIRAGIMSTGIGALVIAVGSLASYFTNTKRGADQLSQAFTAMGAVVDVLTDRLSNVGEALTFIFSGEFRKAGELLKGTFAGITDEIKEEVKAMVELEKRTQALRDADNEFMVQKAKTRQEIEKARLIAEDETKSAAERLTNLKKALELEAKTTEQEIALARERMKIQEEEMALSENLVEDEAELARLKTEIIEKETASIKMRRRVVTEVNALEREIAAEEKARADEKIKLAEEEEARLADIRLKKEKEEAARIAKELADAKMLADEKIRLEQYVEFEKQKSIAMGFSAAQAIAGENDKASKAIAVAQTIYNTQQAIMNAMANVPAPFNVVQAVAAGVMGAASVNSILSTSPGSGSGGGGSVPKPNVATAQPSPQMMSGAFELSNTAAPEPMQAYVVSDDITNNQDKLAAIRRRATI
tara:strand:+ start:1334 stop:2749 length:1416 start_codon:yes stop_codon:yes gene_type:complete